MNSLHRTTGFVFKKEDVAEADRIFFVFTKDLGRVKVWGKAIRKISSKLKSGIELFSFCCFEFIQGRNRKTLKDVFFTEKFRALENSPQKLATAFEICDVLDNLVKGEQREKKIFSLLEDVFLKLNSCPAESRFCSFSYLYFFWNFVSILGYGPELYHCANCKKKLSSKEFCFSNQEGGVICSSCAGGRNGSIKVSADEIKVLRLILGRDWDTLDRLKIERKLQESLMEVSKNYYLYLFNL